MIASNKQLFNIKDHVELVDYFDASTGEIKSRNADNIPFMRMPNGLPCLIANAYVIELYERGLSTRARGGSIRQYAGDISHLIRFCYKKKIDFIQINDSRFIEFMGELRLEKDPSNPEAQRRESNTLNAIGRKCLDFLNFIGKYNGDDYFVVNTIHGFKKTYSIKTDKSNKGYIEQQSWHHKSFDTPSPNRKRSPISKVNIKKLYDAIPKVRHRKESKYNTRLIERRRVVMLRILEMTGARIGEIAELRVKDIEEAFNLSDPKLRLVTLKQEKSQERFIPVLRQDLAALKAYVRVHRKKCIKQTIGAKNDHGYLFVSETTGKHLSGKYMSNEIGLLRRTTGIDGQACAHMFRHRFITKLFVRLISQYDYKTKDTFRRALLDIEMLKQEVQQYTGHKILASLDHYIDLAFEEVSDLKSVISSVNLQSAYESFDINVENLQSELESGLPVHIYIERYRELMEYRQEDVERLNQKVDNVLH